MRLSGKLSFWPLCVVALSVLSIHAANAQPPSAASNTPTKVGGVAVGDILQRLGAKLEQGSATKELENYTNHFNRTDPNRDGKHTKKEYVDNGGYMTPQVRAGIFRAADGNSDGIVTRAEYVLNRIITDEAKVIVQGMDDDKDGLVERTEFVKHAAKLLSVPGLAEQVFAAFDANDDGAVTVPEYLRVWGQWARAGQQPAKQRIAARRAELAGSTNENDAANERDTMPAQPGEGRPGGGPPSGRPGAGAGPPSVDEVFQRMDADKDGKLQKDEVPEFARQFILPADADGDNAVTKEELRKSRERGRPSGDRRPAADAPQQSNRRDRPERPADNRAGFGSGRPGSLRPSGGERGVRPGQPGLGRLTASELKIGKPFPSVKIVDADGKPVSIEQLKGHYTVLVAGCLTCPAFLRSYPGVEAVTRDYASKSVKFYYVYRALAHPENNSIVKPFTLEERLLHVAEAQKRLGTQVPWLADNMNNDFKRIIGNTNNSEFLLDPEGRIVHMQMWSDGGRLRAALEKHLGPVRKPTTVAELGLPSFQMQPATRGAVVPRIEVPGIMVPLKIEPKRSGQPFYVKLRAEAEQSVLEKGSGKIYIGFRIDPMHNTHWNNLVDPLHFEVKAPSGTKVTPASGDGPKLDVEADSDPREFLVSVVGAKAVAPLSLTVRYFACSDDPAWCKSVEQQYSILLARDEFGGAVFGRTFRPPGFGSDFGGGQPGRSRGGRPEFGPPGFRGPPPFGGPPGGFSLERLFRFDRNKDGKVSKAELPEFLVERLLGRADSNKDGAIDKEEAERFSKQLPTDDPSGQQRRRPNAKR